MKSNLKIFLLILTISALLSAAVATAEYRLFFVPRMNVLAYTEKIGPIIQKDIDLTTGMIDFFERKEGELDRLTNEIDTDSKEFIAVVDEILAELEKSRKRYRGFAEKLERIKSFPETEKLKKSAVKINDYYAGVYPFIEKDFNYAKNSADIMDRYTSAIEGYQPGEPQSVFEAVSQLQHVKSIVESHQAELAALEVPETFQGLQDIYLESFSFELATTNELITAVQRFDIAKIEELSNRVYEFPSDARIGRMLDKSFQKFYEPLVREEDRALRNLKRQINDLEKKYGKRWVDDELKFDIEDELETIRERQII